MIFIDFVGKEFPMNWNLKQGYVGENIHDYPKIYLVVEKPRELIMQKVTI